MQSSLPTTVDDYKLWSRRFRVTKPCDGSSSEQTMSSCSTIVVLKKALTVTDGQDSVGFCDKDMAADVLHNGTGEVICPSKKSLNSFQDIHVNAENGKDKKRVERKKKHKVHRTQLIIKGPWKRPDQSDLGGNETPRREHIQKRISASSKTKHTIKKSRKCLTESSITIGSATGTLNHWVGLSNPYTFSTSCAPDAAAFPFSCQSCLVVRYANYHDLRLHEDWCGRSSATSAHYTCQTCYRDYHKAVVLNRHTFEMHKSGLSPVADSGEIQNQQDDLVMDENKLRSFSTVCAPDFLSFPHVCASCSMVSFADAKDLCYHEEWCGLSSAPGVGFGCGGSCPRFFRTEILLQRHQQFCTALPTESLAANGTCDASVDSGISLVPGISGPGHSKTMDKCSIVLPTDQNITEGGADSAIHMCPVCDLCVPTLSKLLKHFGTAHRICSISSAVDVNQKLGTTEQWNCGSASCKTVRCLDCGELFKSRLLLQRHKRMCAMKNQLAAACYFSKLDSSEKRKKYRHRNRRLSF